MKLSIPSEFLQPTLPADAPKWMVEYKNFLTRVLRDISLRLDGCIMEGTIAARPAANGSKRFYMASDTDDLYYDDGTWVKYIKEPTLTKMYQGTDQTIGTSWVVADLDTVSLDPEGICDTTNHRITPTRAGYYMVSGLILLTLDAASTAGAITMDIYRSTGYLDHFNSRHWPGGAGTAYITACYPIYCNGTTTFIDLEVRQLTGVNAIIESGVVNTFLTTLGPL